MMKACLQRVHYDPKYVTPHHSAPPHTSLQARLSDTQHIYGTSQNHRLRDKLEETARKKQMLVQLQKPLFPSSHGKFHHLASKRNKSPTRTKPALDDGEERWANKTIQSQQTKEGEAKGGGGGTMRLLPIRGHDKVPSPPSQPPRVNDRVGTLQSLRLQTKSREGDGPTWSLRIQEKNKDGSMVNNTVKESNAYSYTRNSKDSCLDRLDDLHSSQSMLQIFPSQRQLSSPLKAEPAFSRTVSVDSHMLQHHRSRSLPSSPPRSFINGRTNQKNQAMQALEHKARLQADRAMKSHKIFTIIGPYYSLRQALRKRGWVEKFHNAPSLDQIREVRNMPPNDMMNKPWTEENGIYAMMSYLVRNSTPTFVFTVKSGDVDSRHLKSNQLVNHFGKSRTFTTKIGLCQNLRMAHWFEKVNPLMLHPRCYSFDEPEDKAQFMDDYRMTGCVGVLKWFVIKYNRRSDETNEDVETKASDNTDDTDDPVISHRCISISLVETAVQQCELFLASINHEDIDKTMQEGQLEDVAWEKFLKQCYRFVLEGEDVSPVTDGMVQQCKCLLDKVKTKWPQYHLDGYRNVWILKPGAKSRGRGIECEQKLQNILNKAESSGSWVIQKYIEQPLLVHGIKFDIRQWFLVTDWNPLTVWFYQDSYLRFCTQDFTLDNLNVAIHLSNNYVQKNLNNQRTTDVLPDDNSWTSTEFQKHLRDEGHGDAWLDQIVPGMKKAIICSLQCTQEFIECRKSAFELYGADFMLTENLQPWLLEINSSPSMSRNTHATSLLVDAVMEDTVKDRRSDRSSDTGRFELIYRQPELSNPMPDPSITVQGKKIRQPIGRR